MDLSGKRVVLGVTGGIAAFKAVLLLRLLTKAHAEVRVVLTPGAARFIPPLTFEALSGHPVEVDLWASTGRGGEQHVRLATWADIILVAPATANFMAEQAQGLCRDMLGAMMMASEAPVLMAPAMHHHMWTKPAVQRTVATLKADGVHLVGPVDGDLAEGQGLGRMAEPEQILEAALRCLSPQDLVGQHVLVTAGPTREAMDPVRFISNGSTGKMGYAVARVAARRGAAVTLVSGPTELPPPPGVERVRVQSAAEMYAAVSAVYPSCTVAVMAAAVGDYTPLERSPHKLKKSGEELVIRLKPTVDILQQLGAHRAHQVLVGFAMETQNLVSAAQGKMLAKGCDLMIANDLAEPGAGFAHDTNRVTLIRRDGSVEALPLLSKEQVAGRILDEIRGLLPRQEG